MQYIRRSADRFSRHSRHSRLSYVSGIDETEEDETKILLPDPSESIMEENSPLHDIHGSSASFDFLFLRRFFHVMKFSGTTFFSRPHLYLWQIILISALLSQGSAITADWTGKVIGKLTKAEEVWDMLPMGFLLYYCVSTARAVNLFLTDILGWYWRKNITTKLNDMYIEGANPFLVNYCKNTLIDNPDQRIVADIKSLCDNLSVIVVNGIQGVAEVFVLSLSIYNVVGWPSLLMVHLPTLLFFAFYKIVLAKIAYYTFKQDKLEGDFRYYHARIRDYSESIAFYQGEDMERQNCEKAFDLVTKNKKVLAKWNAIFKFVNAMNRWVPEVGIFFGTALMLWQDNLSRGDLTRLITTVQSNSFTLMGAVQNVFALGGPLGIVSGSVSRVAQLLEMCEYLNKNQPNRTNNIHDIEDAVHLVNVTCRTPQHTTLVRDLNLEIPSNNSLLIMGPSGCGKSSLLRCFPGLWQFEGDIYRPTRFGTKGILYLTQKPYLTNGSFLDQIIYPDKTPKFGVNDNQLVEILRKTNMGYILKQKLGWDAVHNWSEMLSLGEQQRIMFARLFYHNPSFAVLDEATSALDLEDEKIMYEECLRLGMTLISVGHRDSLKKFHKQLLMFNGTGGCKITDIKKESLNEPENTTWQRVKVKKGNLDLNDLELSLAALQSKLGNKQLYVSKAWDLIKIGHKSHHIWSKNTIIFILFVVSAVVSALCTGGLPIALSQLSNSVILGNLPLFYIYTIIAMIVATALSILAGLSAECSYWLGIIYRVNLTKYIHLLYFNKDITLQLNTAHKEIDNPDQRVTTDIDNFTSGFDAFGLFNILQVAFLAAPVPLVCTFVVVGYTGWITVPLILGAIALVFSLSVPFVSFIGKLEYNLSKEEGNFRFKHIEIRENAETIGFYGQMGSRREKAVVADTFEKVLEAQWSAIKGRALFNFYYHFSIGSSRPLSLIIVLASISATGGLAAIPKVKLYGIISQASSLTQTAILQSLSMFSIIGPMGQNNGHLTRVTQMMDKMNHILADDKNTLKAKCCKKGPEIEFEGAVCVTPTGKRLNQFGISVKVPPKKDLILMGPSGSGKSSLLRALGGLWPLEEGSVTSPERTFFLPQKPYMVIGTLRDQVIYPQTANKISSTDEELVLILEKAHLGYLLTRFGLDSTEIWNSVLSPGEQQRLCVARLFYHRPTYAVLDESTSALDGENEDAMYKMCHQLGITLVSVGHRESLLQHHSILLRLDGRGGWDLYKREALK